MGGLKDHTKLAKENAEGVRSEHDARRYSNVGLLAVKALEQIVEACAAKEGLHFHEHPRTAHRNRRDWLKTHHPDLVEDWDALWAVYGTLGYGGVNGDKAHEALQILDQVLNKLVRRESIEL